MIRRFRTLAPAHRKKTIATVGIALLVLVAAWHYWTMFSTARALEGDLDRLEEWLSSLELVGLDEGLSAPRQDVRDADKNLDSFRRHFRADPFVLAGRVVPGLRGQVTAADGLLKVTSLAVGSASEAVDAAEIGDRLDRESPADTPATEILVAALNEAGPQIDRMAELTAEMVERRAAIGDRSLMPPLGRVRTRLDAKLPDLADAVERFAAARETLPGLLGFEGERRYLLLALNEGELLPGGGLVTASGVMTVVDGRPSNIDFVDSAHWKRTWEAQGGGYIQPPGPLKRYLLKDYTWNLLVSNWSPDFPTWSRQALEFYELINGPQEVDGIISVDLEVMKRLLRVTGPKELEVEGRGTVRFTEKNAIITMEALTRNAFEEGADRKSVIGDLADLVIRDLLRLPAERWGAIADEITGLGDERHIQAFSFDQAEQTLLRDLGWDGRLVGGVDYVQINEASLNSTKLNLILEFDGTYRIEVNSLGDAKHDLTLNYRNPLPEWAADKDPNLVSSLMLGGLYGGYLRIFAPAGTASYDATRGASGSSVEDTGTDGDLTWFGLFFPLPAGDETELRLTWTVPAAATSTGDYSLYIQKQPGTAGLCLDIELSRNGQPPRELRFAGGRQDSEGRRCAVTDISVTAHW